MGAKELLQYYKDHIVSVEEAMKIVKSGDLIMDGHGHGRSPIFGPELMKRADELNNVRFLTGYNLESTLHCDPQYEGHFKQISVFNTATTRNAQWEGRADYMSIHFSQMERGFEAMKPRILFTQVTPPNEEGYVSMGVSVDFTRHMVDVCPIVIAQVNNNMPWLNGDAVIPCDKIDYFIEEDTDLKEIPFGGEVSDVVERIAENCAQIINDGDTIQIGVGSIPDTVLSLLSNHKHLGIHTELGSTGIMKLMQAGVIDNSRKTINAGKVVCTLLGGTKEFYDFINHNDDFVTRKSSYVLNPAVIAQHKNMVAINSAIEIDLFGQSNSEMIGRKEFSGVGGQVDFLRGAMMSEGGKSILCLSATAAKGTKSTIVPEIAAGTVVTASRYDIMYVVTEYGIADLWGKTNYERAKELIKIAAPQFREELEKAYWNNIHKVV